MEKSRAAFLDEMRREEGHHALVQIPGSYFLAARELLDNLLIEFTVLIAFCHCYKPLSFKGWFMPLGKYVLVPAALLALVAGALLGGIG